MKFAEVVTFVAMVSVVVTAVPELVAERLAGLKEQVEYAGRPEQAKSIVPVKPPLGVSVIAVVPDCPATMFNDEGLAARLKPGATELLMIMVKLVVAVSGVLSESFASTVKSELPAVVGVPEIMPEAEPSESPTGRLPVLTLQV
jgi:hypothetical protein